MTLMSIYICHVNNINIECYNKISGVIIFIDRRIIRLCSSHEWKTLKSISLVVKFVPVICLWTHSFKATMLTLLFDDGTEIQ